MTSNCRKSKTRGRGQQTHYCNPRPRHDQIVIHTRLTNVRYCRMRPTITSNTRKGPDVKILKGGEIVVKFP